MAKSAKTDNDNADTPQNTPPEGAFKTPEKKVDSGVHPVPHPYTPEGNVTRIPGHPDPAPPPK